MILRIPRRSLEQVENELCACRQQLRQSRKAAGEAFATSATLRQQLDQAQARAADVAKEYRELVDVIKSDEARLVEQRKLVRRLAIELRALRLFRRTIERSVEASSRRLRLKPFQDEPLSEVPAVIQVGFLVEDTDGAAAGIVVVARSRPIVQTIVERILPLAPSPFRLNAEGAENAEKS